MNTDASERTVPADASMVLGDRSARALSLEERRQLVAQSLQVGNPGNNARLLPEEADPRVECQIEVEVDSIQPYGGNPRRWANPKFEEIKASIREIGIRSPLSVTRRPGERHFTVEAGGNTRLIALQQLWAETRDARYQKLVVVFRPWCSERHVLSAHLIENELRGELAFWDKALGVLALKQSIEAEAEAGEELALRDLALELRRLGLTINSATLSHCLYAAQRLRILGEAIPDLTGLDVRILQPRLNELRRYARDRAGMTEDAFYDGVLAPVFEQFANACAGTSDFSVQALCCACEEALARATGDPVEVLRATIAGLARSPEGAGSVPCPADAAVVMPMASEQAQRAENDPLADESAGLPVHGARAGSADDSVKATRLRELAHVFASVAGIAHCLQFDAQAPTGFQMQPLPELDAREPTRGRAWGLLASLSGLSSLSIPAPALDAAFVQWLTDSRDEAANAFWDLLALARTPCGSPLKRDATEGPH